MKDLYKAMLGLNGIVLVPFVNQNLSIKEKVAR